MTAESPTRRLDGGTATPWLQWGRGHVTAERRPPVGVRTSRSTLQWGRGHVTAERSLCTTVEISVPELQWGRGHVTAESSLLEGGARLMNAASMGPRSCDRGEPDLPPRVVVGGPASMGPRSCDRGEADQAHACRRIMGASMGPRSCDRGELKKRRPARRGKKSASMGPRSCDRGEGQNSDCPVPQTGLQWGRGHVTAERPEGAVALRGLDAALQWGRGHVTAERPARTRRRPGSSEASMGPRSCDRGEAGGVVPYAIAIVASMGPRSCDRGEDPCVDLCQFQNTCFNGAAVM